MFQQKGLIFFCGYDLAGDQMALVCPPPRQVRLQKAETLGRVARVDRSQDVFAMNA
jgi:hypothetical protein